MINFELQNHKPLREIVYDELKRQIMVGEIAPHTRMMEVELADEMGVSRTPIREAIRKLEKEGLVTIEPRKGAYAADISIKEMVDVFDVREYLEGMAASLAATKITSDQKAELEEIAESFKEAVESGNIQQVVKYDEDFHKFIVKCSDNKTLVQLVSQVQDLSLRFRYIYYEDFSRFKHIPTEHAEIVEAIIRGDSEKARDEMSAHISELKNFVVSNSEKIAKK